jgi:fermentation-respiration switch protein FrsA (DUF1100 family)
MPSTFPLSVRKPLSHQQRTSHCPRVIDCPVEIVHGWRDEVVPLENSMRFAREYGAPLHVLDDDHRLHTSVRRLKHLFEFFLISIDLPPEFAR